MDRNAQAGENGEKKKEKTAEGERRNSRRSRNSPAAHRETTLEQVLPCSQWWTMVAQRPAWKPTEEPMLFQVIIPALQPVARAHSGAVHEGLWPTKGPALEQGI